MSKGSAFRCSQIIYLLGTCVPHEVSIDIANSPVSIGTLDGHVRPRRLDRSMML